MSKEKKNNPTLKIKINKIFILNDKIKKKLLYDKKYKNRFTINPIY